METTQETNKTLYQSPSDYPEMSGEVGIENNLNILGDDISTESQDVVMGASGTSSVCCLEVSGSCGSDVCESDVCESNLCSNDTCVGDVGYTDTACPKDGSVCVLLSSSGVVCTTLCASLTCPTDCTSDTGVCSSDIIECTTLTGCTSNSASTSDKISTDSFLNTKFKVGIAGSALCTTKSRAITLGLSVINSSNYGDKQLLPEKAVAGPTAATMNIEIDVHLRNTIFAINKSRYSISGTSYLVPYSYSNGGVSKAKTYLTNVGNYNVFKLDSMSSNFTLEVTNCIGEFQVGNSMGVGSGVFNAGKYSGNLQLGTFKKNGISTKKITGFDLSLSLKDNGLGTTTSEAMVVSLNSVVSVIITTINIDVTPYGVNWSSSQPGGCSGTLTTNSYTLSNGVGTFKGTMNIDKLVF